MKTIFLDVKFKGGLGNQLFQYANARCICLKNNIPYLLFNTDNYKFESLDRKFSLLNYPIKGKLIECNVIAKNFRVGTKANKILSSLGFYGRVEECDFKKQKIILGHKPFTSLIGYWQSDYYFKDIRPQLLKELTPIEILALPLCMALPNTVAVHVRRKDYLDEGRYGFIGINYYNKAMAKIQSIIADAKFIFFSDDLDWCKNSFDKSEHLFFNEPGWEKDYLQLYLMSQCKHQIIANSSFSWWGAWLNTNVEKMVIRPAEPFKDKSLLYESHYPAEWIAIENK